MGEVGCLVVQAECLVGFMEGSVLTVDMAEGGEEHSCGIRFWIASDACSVSWCYKYLHTADILCNMIKNSQGSL